MQGEYRILQDDCCKQHSTHDSPLNFDLTLGTIRLCNIYNVQSSVELRVECCCNNNSAKLGKQMRNLSFSVVFVLVSFPFYLWGACRNGL